MKYIGIEYDAPGHACFYSLEDPPHLRPTEFLLETYYSGITNGTERHSLVGEYYWENAFPARAGYQHVGKVIAMGDAVTNIVPGDWVFYGNYVGHRGWNIVNVADSNPYIKLADDVDPKDCALFGVASVALRGIRRIRTSVGQNVWVVGAGLIGQFAAQAARAVGAEVTITDVRQSRLDIARECGAQRAINVSDPSGQVELKSRCPFDCVVDASGIPNLLHEIAADELIKHRGVISLMAVRGETSFPWSMMHMTECSIEVSCHFDSDDLRILQNLLQRGFIKVSPLVTHFVPISDSLGIYDILRDRPGDLLGVIFDWQK
ncbi:MAG: zinc-binding dehydrogenase [Armatimonadota bacterium]